MVDMNIDFGIFSYKIVENFNKDVYMIFGVIFIVMGFFVFLGNIVIFYVVKRDFLKCFNKLINVFNIVLIIIYVLVGMIVLLFIGILSIF